MKPNSSIAVVIPVYNEGNVLGGTVDQLLKYRSAVDFNFHIILVDDGSTDNCFGNINAEGAKDLIILRHEKNLGQGAALSTGLKFVRENGYDLMVHFDADGQHPCNAIQDLIAPILAKEAEVVLGSRFLNKSSMNQIPFSRKLLLRLALIIDNYLSGIQKTDVHNGLRAFGRNAIEKINIRAPRMEHASEIIWEIKRCNLSYKEVPVNIIYTRHSMAKQKSFAYPWIALLRIFRYKSRYKKNLWVKDDSEN